MNVNTRIHTQHLLKDRCALTVVVRIHWTQLCAFSIEEAMNNLNTYTVR